MYHYYQQVLDTCKLKFPKLSVPGAFFCSADVSDDDSTVSLK
jgi:hypothetical protein